MTDIAFVIRREDNKIYEFRERNVEVKKNVHYMTGLYFQMEKDQKCLNIRNGNNSYYEIVLPISQNEDFEMQDGDLIVGIKDMIIHFKKKDESIDIKTNKEIKIKCEHITIEGDLTVKGKSVFEGSMEHDGKKVDSSHTHKYEKSSESATVAGKADSLSGAVSGTAVIQNTPTETQAVS